MKHEIIILAEMEWYNGTDIDSPDYQCGLFIPIE